MTERERTVAVLRGFDRAIVELEQISGAEASRQWPENFAAISILGLKGQCKFIIDTYNNDGLPETEPIRPEEWKQEEAC